MTALLSIVPLRGWLIISAIVAALGGSLYVYHHLIDIGAQRATAKIERANDAANQNADQAETDYYQRFDQCRSAGGTWDRANRMCLAGSGNKALRRDPR